ncbi:MerR family transcriptional regulator [Micromonospora sp. NPDC023644]|uniref:MerR family transcriptional regulator n=1 Tax=Micromonospora sp. NPDC023644 TaxID=3154321 RepID=UPI0033CC2F48
MERPRTWKVGELARATGLTVRTLHHWDHLGLVTPSGRTAAGHRRYEDRDVERLYEVLALRRLGVPLATVGELLGGSASVEDVLRQHLRLVDEQLVALRRLRAGLGAMVGAHPRSTADFLGLIREVVFVDEIVERYFTAEQLAGLAERREREAGQVAAVEAAWPELIARVQAAVDAGTDPAGEHGRALAAEWADLLERFHRGDDELRRSLYAMQAENADTIRREHGGPSAEQIAFIAAASAEPGAPAAAGAS